MLGISKFIASNIISRAEEDTVLIGTQFLLDILKMFMIKLW